MKKESFTLIELLTVLAIIAVLAAILLPVFGSAQATAQSVKCQSNLRQIGIGLTQFTTDNSSILTKSAYGSTAAATDTGPNYKWMDAIFPYVSREEVFQCPSDMGAKYRAAKKLTVGETSTDYGSYGLNGAYRDAGDGQTPPRSAATYQVNWLQIEQPGSTVWVTDTNNREEAGGSFGITWANSSTNPTITTTAPRQLEKVIERHRGATNVLFCDGHVESRRLESLAIQRTVIDSVSGATKTVLPLFTIEAD